MPVHAKREAPFGSWASPISTELLVQGTVGLGEIRTDGGDVYWLEGRPWEAGRSALVRRDADGSTSDVTPPPWNVRTRVHEYGGGAYVVDQGTVYFSHFADQRLYRLRPGGQPEAITPEAALRYADAIADRWRDRLICVREDHRESDQNAINTIMSIALPGEGGSGGGESRVLVAGHDFFSSPRLSPDGTRLAWLAWDHPNMPWDGTELWVAGIGADGSLEAPRRMAGGHAESIVQPEWSPDGALHFVSDRTGWWNHYRLGPDGSVQALCPMEAEFGYPQWVFGMSAYAFTGDGRLVCAYKRDGADHLAVLPANPGDGSPRELDVPYSVIDGVRARQDRVYFLGSAPNRPTAVVELVLAADGSIASSAELRRATDVNVDRGYLSVPEPITFPTTDGAVAHALYYAPANADFKAPAGERPPLLVLSHGGPTGASGPGFHLGTQFWTSRGFAVVDVNYRGSTGYGRAYRDALKGRWGIADVDDCVAAALFLVERGDVDPRRLAIRGGSAGGYTTLAALAFRDVFHAGASHFGVSDVEALALDTHKFESRYLDGLIGPYPERRDLYVARSPVHAVDRLNCPIIFFQGLEDRVVPPNQAERMVEALRGKGVPVAYVAYPREGHGFREAAHIRRTYEAELYFYSRIFGFTPAEPLEPVEIR